jgi:hypothetical protein
LSNLEKYAPQLLRENPLGNECLADGVVKPFVSKEYADLTKWALPIYPSSITNAHDRLGLWLHTDDLAPEIGPLTGIKPIAVAAFTMDQSPFLSDHRKTVNQMVLNDAITRSAAHYRCLSEVVVDGDVAGALGDWAQFHDLKEVVSFAPFVGPEQDHVGPITERLASLGIRFTLVRRESDEHAFSLSTAGFFPFWEKMKHGLTRNLAK